MRASRGFTLVELVIAMAIMAIVGAVVAVLLYNYANLYFANNDVVAASQRADMVFRLMNEAVHHAGLGVSSATPDEYKRSWKSGNISASDTDVPYPAKWEGVIVPKYQNSDTGTDAIIFFGTEADGGHTGIGILYAEPTGAVVSSEVTIASGNAADVDLIDYGARTLQATTNAQNMNSWVTVPGVTKVAPLQVTAAPTATLLKVKNLSANAVTMHANQEIYKMKALMAWSEKDADGFYVFRAFDVQDETSRANLKNPITEIRGIRAVRFQLSEDRKYLELDVLAMGDTGVNSDAAVHSTTLAPAIKARWKDKWKLITDDDARYYLEEFSVKWRVRNLGASE